MILNSRVGLLTVKCLLLIDCYNACQVRSLRHSFTNWLKNHQNFHYFWFCYRSGLISSLFGANFILITT